MTLPIWYHIEQIARDDLKKYSNPNGASLAARRKHAKSRKPAPLSKSRLLFTISMLALLSATALYLSDLRTRADSAAPLASPHSILPSSQNASSTISSSSPTVLVSPGSVSIGAVGSTFTIQIKVQNMAQFNGWDIEVFAYPTIINATSMSITGNDFDVNASSGSAFEIVHCVNGKGTGCTSTDGPGIVHSAYGNTAILTGNGLLFTITYQVIGYDYSPIHLQNDLISSPSSGNGVAHDSISGSYGVSSAGGGGGGRWLET